MKEWKSVSEILNQLLSVLNEMDKQLNLSLEQEKEKTLKLKATLEELKKIYGKQ